MSYANGAMRRNINVPTGSKTAGPNVAGQRRMPVRAHHPVHIGRDTRGAYMPGAGFKPSNAATGMKPAMAPAKVTKTNPLGSSFFG